MGVAKSKTLKGDKENATPDVGSPIEKPDEFHAIPEENTEEAPERRISFGTFPIKIPSHEPVPQSSEKKKEVPFEFRWKYGANEVYLAGDFNNWEYIIPLNKSQGDFTGMYVNLSWTTIVGS